MRTTKDTATDLVVAACWALLDSLDMPAKTADELREKYNWIQFCSTQLKELLALIGALESFRVYRGPPL